MAGMTNTQKIVELLRQHPGLDDDEISRLAHVTPRQQVNQICRRLEAQGVIRRNLGPKGKVVNELTGFEATRTVAVPRQQSATASRPAPESISPASDAFKLDLRDTLVFIPCSGAKISGGTRDAQGPSILNGLPEDLLGPFKDARAAVARQARMDESLRLPAWKRYAGSLYESARQALAPVMESAMGSHVVVLSGGYGLALAAEPIGIYDMVFKRRAWPYGLLAAVALDFAKRNNIRRVRAFASLTTEYGKFLRSVPWADAGVQDAVIFCPEPTTGAMIKSPRAQGEALAALLSSTLHDGWRSSDGLRLETSNLLR